MSKFEGIPTPWGESQGGNRYMPGVLFFHTAGHGGLKIARELNQKIPAVFRNEDGWYEEDCDFAIPFYFLHEAIREHCLTHGLEGHTMSAQEWFAKYDAAYYRGVMERWHTAECVLHFGKEYSDEELQQRFSSRDQLNAQIASLKARIGIHQPSA